MDIIASIIKLLAHQKSVEVPSIGTFYQKKNPGKFDPSKQLFNPPTFSVLYAKIENGDDSLLNFLIKENNLSKDNAVSQLKTFSQQVWQQLDDQKIADLNPLGRLVIEDNSINFIENINFSSPNQFFGLLKQENIFPNESNSVINNDPEPIQEHLNNSLSDSPAKPLSESFADSIPEHILEPTQNSNLETTTAEALVEQEKQAEQSPVVKDVWKPTVNQKYEYDPSDDEEDDNSSKRKILKWSIIIIISLAILSSLAYIFYPRYFDDLYNRINPPKYKLEDVNTIDTPKHSLNDLLIADSLALDSLNKSHLIDSALNNQHNNSSANSNKPNNNTPNNNTPNNSPNNNSSNVKQATTSTVTTYEVIGAAMRTEKKADEVVNNFSKLGLPAKKLYNTGGRLIKISLGSYTDINKASKVKDSLRKKLKNPEIYIQTVKPKN